MIVIGITGTNGAGKGRVVDYLVKNKNFAHYSVREFLIEEIKKRNLPTVRDSMVTVANELREKHGASYIVEQLYKLALENGQNCVIESIRTVGEVKSLREKADFVLLAVTASPKIRYERIVSRASSTDNITFEKFMEDEEKEMSSSDEAKQNLEKCIEMSDFLLQNNGSIENLYEQIEKIFTQIK